MLAILHYRVWKTNGIDMVIEDDTRRKIKATYPLASNQNGGALDLYLPAFLILGEQFEAASISLKRQLYCLMTKYPYSNEHLD